MKMRNWVTGLSAVLGVMGCVLVAAPEALAAEIPQGVYIGENDLSGKTEEEAGQMIQSYVDSLTGQKITLDVDGTAVETTAGELGFHWSNTDAVDQAVNAVSGGNLIQQYMKSKDLEHEPMVIPLETQVDQEKVTAFVSEKCAEAATPAQDAVITRENGAFKVTPSVVGKTVDVDETLKTLNEALSKGLDQPITVTVPIEEQQPARTTEALSTIQDVLGTFSTDFKSSGAARSKNLSVGAGKINGHVLMPGETLSGYECMQPFTTANGYATAAAYENGMVVDSVGGGVCQIATTLYNAALRAEVEITQRQNHSMVVSYVDHSADAAIAGTYKDIKITNNYSTPVYVEGYTSGKTLTFTIYGKETRPANRKVEFISETLKVTDPGEPILKEDPSLPPGAKVKLQSGHKGVRSKLWKSVLVDGVETERTLLSTDTYNPSKAIYRVGPAEAAAVPETTPPETTPALPETAAPVETPPETGVAGGPGV